MNLATGFRLKLKLKLDTPVEVVSLVRLMVERTRIATSKRPYRHIAPLGLPEHPFFCVPNWELLLRNSVTTTQMRFGVRSTVRRRDTPCERMTYTFGYARLTVGRHSYQTLDTFSRPITKTEPKYLQLEALGCGEFDEQDYGLFASWLLPYLHDDTDPGTWLVMAQLLSDPSPRAVRIKRNKRLPGVIKAYYRPIEEGEYPTMNYLRGSIIEPADYIL